MEGVKGENEEISITNTYEIKIEDFCVQRGWSNFWFSFIDAKKY